MDCDDSLSPRFILCASRTITVPGLLAQAAQKKLVDLFLPSLRFSASSRLCVKKSLSLPNSSQRVFRPGVFGVSASQVFTDLRVGVLPEAGQVVGDLLRSHVGGQ